LSPASELTGRLESLRQNVAKPRLGREPVQLAARNLRRAVLAGPRSLTYARVSDRLPEEGKTIEIDNDRRLGRIDIG
jgi:hypothetical protein